MNLRARKKEQTREELSRAAYEIAVEEGMDALTAEAIAARTGVSRRTFFNYFPTVDSALSTAVADFFTSLSLALAAEPCEEPVMDALDRIVAGPVPPGPLQRITMLAALGESSPHARRIITEVTSGWAEWLEEHLAERLGGDVDPLYVTNLTHAILAAAESSVRVWGRRTGAVLTPESVALHRELLAASMRYVRVGFAEDAPRA